MPSSSKTEPRFESERDLQRYWGNLPFPCDFVTLEGEEISVIHPGMPNANPGPDYLDALISVQGNMVRGDIELHLHLQGWIEHGHQSDPNYSQVLVHVIGTEPGSYPGNFPGDYPPNTVLLRAEAPVQSTKSQARRCEQRLPPLNVLDILAELGWERIRMKSEQFRRFREQLGLADLWYLKTLRCLGYSHNTTPMELIAGRLPRALTLEIAAHFTPEMQFDFLLGLTGFGDYAGIQTPVWNNLAEQYQLQGVRYYQWQVLRHRPENHPLLRLYGFLRRIGRWEDLFRTGSTHFDAPGFLREMVVNAPVPERFIGLVPLSHATIGRSRATEVVINSFLPLWLLEDELTPRSIQQWTETLPAIPYYTMIRNFLRVTRWNERFRNRSLPPILLQGLLCLMSRYCKRNRCEECPVFNSNLEE